MSIVRRVEAVEKLYKKLDNEIYSFAANTKIHCEVGCGKCCTNPTMEASPLEFLPWAFHLFLNGQAEIVLEKLRTKTNPICHIYNPFTLLDNSQGNCSNYPYRGLICRLFGFGANTDKYGKLRLLTCKIIKEGQTENYQKASESIEDGLPVPIFTEYYMNLSQIDFKMGNTIVPINIALKMAIEEVLQYYAYRPMPDGMAFVA
jgi:uncharacterized protein